MKKTEMVFILDRSGSMSGLEEDTIGGYNSMLKRQQEKEGKAIVTTVLFDNECKIIHDRTDIEGIRPLTEKDHQADKVMFVIITDGMENASREYSYEKVKNKDEKSTCIKICRYLKFI